VAKLETIQIPDPFLFIQVSKKMQTVLFRDRTDAARQLAERLKNEMEKSKSSVVIVAIPRGGIVIGNIIAKELRTKLDLVVTRKIGAHFNPELTIGAVMPDGSYSLNDVAVMINISQNYIESHIRKEVKEIEGRLI
jgi:putative phosphoribosyl transferase